jgi:Sugar (and other) transporter
MYCKKYMAQVRKVESHFGESRHYRSIHLQRLFVLDYDISPIVLDMKEALQREEADKKSLGWDMLLFPTPSVRRMLFIGVWASIAQQAVGIDAIQHFLIYILRESGIDSLPAQLGILISISFVKLIFIMIGGRQFDSRGRRPILFVSLCGMTASLILLSINFFGSTNSVLITIIGLSTYLSLYSLGVGPGSWLITAEIFPTCIRARAVSLCTFCNRIAATLMSSTFLSTATAMSWSGFFFLLSCVCIAILVFLYYFLPETRGRSLEDMSVFFAEIAGDQRLLDAEDRITREREAALHAQETAPQFIPKKPREVQRGQLLDAKIMGTMA